MSRPGAKPKAVSKKRKFVRDGVFFTELNEFFDKELSEDGYTGCNVRVTPSRTEIIIRSTNLDKVVGKEERRIRELTALVQKRFNFKPGSLICIAGTLKDQSLSALVQAQSVKFKLLEGLSVRRAAYAVLKFIKEKGAKGCEVVVSGKLRGQRAKAMKFREGYMIHAGDAVNYYIDEAVKHVHLRQGVLGIKVKIMLPSASEAMGGEGVAQELPDKIELPTLKELPADALLKQQMRDRQIQLQQQAQQEEQQPEFDAYPTMDVGVVEDPSAGYGGAPPESYEQYGQPGPQEYGGNPPDAGYPMPAEYGMPDQQGPPQGYDHQYGAPQGGGGGYPPQGGPPPYADQGGYPPQSGYGAGGGGDFPQY